MEQKKKEKKAYLGKTLKRMLRDAWKENRRLFGQSFLYMLIGGISPFLPVLLPKLLISILEGGNPFASFPLPAAADATPALQIGMVIGAYFIVAGLFSFFERFLDDVNYNPVSRLRINCLTRTFEKLIMMDYRYREDAHFLDQYELAFQAPSSNANGIEGIYHNLFKLPSQVLSILILVLLIGMRAPLILLGLALNIGMGLWVQERVNQCRYSKKDELSKASRRCYYYHKTTHDFTAGKDIRLFGFEKRIIDNYNYEIGRYVNIIKLVENRAFGLGVLALLTALISDVLTYGCLIYSVINGMSIADFSMYLSAVLTLTTLLSTFSTDITFLFKESLYVDDYYRFLDTDLGTKGGTHPALSDTLEIEFRNVTFRYPGTEKDIFKNLNFTIHKGEKLAIVGVNGAGKSTLVKLMTGLFEPTDGEIFINGIPQKDFDKQAYFKMFSVVFQDIHPIAFTIGENVACTTDGIQQELLWNCLSRAGLADKVRGFEKQTEQMMLKIIDENGTQFSGGENQKLLIARALYKNANMVILDEPTAALDALAESEIYQHFDGLIQGKTAVYISHRLSSTKFCDKIALFDGDGLAEYGTHEELMALHGSYYHMFSVQGKYYTQEVPA